MYQILQGDNRDTLKTLADNSIDAIVTDPPYGIDFLGKAWDANTGALETYQQCLRVLKPGGHILAFSAARTYHHLAVTLEQAGFEIRDQIMWIYSSGFPKSQDIGRSIQRGIKNSDYYTKEEWEDLNGYKGMPSGDSTFGHSNQTDGQKSAGLSGKVVKVTDPVAKAWSGWGTALKPAHEPIALARKPIKLSIARNCQTHGVGALNIDACRVPFENEDDQPSGGENGWSRVGFSETPVEKYCNQKSTKPKPGKMGTTAHDNYNAEKNADQGLREGEQLPWTPSDAGRFPANVIGDIAEPYQKYFYCPKVSRAERHIGFDTANIPQIGSTHPDDVKRHPLWDPSIGGDAARLKQKIIDAGEYKGNNHPTVKPIELMKYLIKLITPPGGTVLDPFTGSGSTGCAAVELGHKFIGCELDPAYVDIANRRIGAWADQSRNPDFDRLFSTA